MVVRTIQTLNDLPSYQECSKCLFIYQAVESAVCYLANLTSVFLTTSVVGFFLIFSPRYSGIGFLLCSKRFSTSKSECKEEKTPNLQNTVFLFSKSVLLTHFKKKKKSENNNP